MRYKNLICTAVALLLSTSIARSQYQQVNDIPYTESSDAYAQERCKLDVYYSTQTARQLSDPKYGLQLMSDGYIVENILAELRGQSVAPLSSLLAASAIVF